MKNRAAKAVVLVVVGLTVATILTRIFVWRFAEEFGNHLLHLLASLSCGLHPNFPSIISRVRRLLTCPAKARTARRVSAVKQRVPAPSGDYDASGGRLFASLSRLTRGRDGIVS